MVGGGGHEKASVYAGFGNHSLLRLVSERLPLGGAVLDVGCASGGLLAGLPGAGRREGIEPDPVAAAAAESAADRVHVGALGEPLDVDQHAFDVVVLGDVLEHLADPQHALAVAGSWVRPGGFLVISLPNVAHWTIRLQLLLGHWEYQDRGILDDTHLRFFTWETGARLVADAGLTVVERRPVVSKLDSHVPVRVPTAVERQWQRVGRRLPSLFAFQQLLVATT